MSAADVPLPPEFADPGDPFGLDAAGIASGVLDDEDGDLPERIASWRIEDDGAAEWAMRHVAAIDREVAEHALRREAWVERITAWFDRVTAPLARRRAFFETHLVDYGLRCRAAGRKSVPLPSGTIRTSGPASPETARKVVITDEAAVVEWVRRCLPDVFDDYVKVTETPRLTELRAILRAVDDEHVVDGSGEIVPGVAVEWVEPTAKVVPS